jgi:hypothetical protein
MPEREPDYYAILNLPPESSIDAVREQFRRIVRVFHPDRHSGDVWCEEQIKLVNEAYAYLSDASRKAEYDKRRGRRGSDALAFDSAFEPAPALDAHESVQTWTFDAKIASNADKVHDPELSDYLSWGTVIDRPSVSQPARRPAAGSTQQFGKNAIRYGIALACIAVVVAVIVLVGSSQSRPVYQQASTAFGAVSSNAAITPPTSVGQGPSPVSEPTITAADIRRANMERHDDAVTLHLRVEPYWSRFERLQPRVAAALAGGRTELAAMEIADVQGAGGASRPGSPRFQHEAELSSDIEELQYKVNDIQARFDDLEYSTTDQDVDEALQDLDHTIGSIERSQDPLFSDLQNAAQKQSH